MVAVMMVWQGTIMVSEDGSRRTTPPRFVVRRLLYVIVCETADAGGADVHIVGGNDSKDEETESCDHEDGGVRGTGMSRYSVRATCPDVLAVQENFDMMMAAHRRNNHQNS